MDHETIAVDVADRIMTITLSRPDRLNAFNIRMLREMLDTFDRADADDDVRVVIVTGAGRAFCAGADLDSGGATFDYESLGIEPPAVRDDGAPGELRDGGGLLTLRIFQCTKPVIAAINGPAVGVGATMTLPMDIRIAADTARFGVLRGPGDRARGRLELVPARVVGISRALEWCYSARVFPASEALEGGLVRSLHPADDVVTVARGIAAEIVANSAPVSVALTRMMMWRMLGASHPMEAHKIDSRGVNHLGRTRDAGEGITAFFEKRPAEWSMSVADDLPAFVPWWDEPEFS